MKSITIAALLILALACKVEKTGKDTYKVVAPTPEAKAAAEKAKVEAKELGDKAKQGAAEAAVKVGGAMEKAGEKAKAEGTKTEKRVKH